MGRGRIAMELIEKEKARKTTFEKRKSGLFKKMYEFSILCDVDVCAIIYAPGSGEPETWPKDKREVERIIEKYYNTTSDRRPKIYDVEEYYKERMKKVEGEVAKVRKEIVKVMYPTWDDSFNSIGEEELRMFASNLDAKLDACNQKLKGGYHDDPKGKEILLVDQDQYSDKLLLQQGGGSEQMMLLTDPFLASNNDPNSNTHFKHIMMQNNNCNMMLSQAQLFPPLLSCDHNNHYPLAFWQQQQQQQQQYDQMGQCSHSQPPPPSTMLHFGQYGITDLVNVNQVGAVTNCDPKAVSIMIKDDDGNDQNNNNNLQNSSSSSSSPYYYNGYTQTLESSYSIPSHQTDLANLPFQTMPPAPAAGSQLNGFYDANTIYQAHMFNYMHGRK